MIATQTPPSSIASRSVMGSWVAANALGLGLGMAAFAAVAHRIAQSGAFGSPQMDVRIGHLVGLALAGAIFGAAQWRVLRRYAPISPWIVLGTLVGLLIGYILGYEFGGPPIDFVLAPALAGLFGGFQQSQALRPARRAGGWPWVSALGLLFGGAAGTAVALAGLGNALGGGLVAWIILNGIIFAIAGAVDGAISGAMLRRLVQHTES